MTFLRFLRALLGTALLGGSAIGILLGAALLFAGKVGGTISIDIDLVRSDSLWLVVLTPLLFALLFLLSSPLSFLLRALLRRLRGAGGS